MGFFISEFEKFRNKNLFRFISRAPKSEYFLVLDIGTAAVKTLIFSIPEYQKTGSEKRIVVLGSSLEYFDKFGAFGNRKFEIEVTKKAIFKAINEAQTGAGVKTNLIYLGLPANILKARTISQSFERKTKGVIDEKEEGEILKDIFKEAKEKISKIYALQKGILPQDLQFLNLKILETKIDGYSVPDLLGYEGKSLNFRIFATFLPKYHLQSNLSDFLFPSVIPIIKEMGFEISGLFHEGEGLISYLAQEPNGIFLDVGGEVTQVFLAKESILEQVSEFDQGGKDFSQILSERLGLSELEARVLKHRYSKRDLSEESRERIREFLKIAAQNWLNNLRDKLKEMSSGIFPSEIFIFGGGALLPEIGEMLENGDWGDISFPCPPKVKFIYPRDLKNIEEKTKILNGPQDTPPFLLCYASHIGEGSGAPHLFF